MKNNQQFFNAVEFIKQLELLLEMEAERKYLKEELNFSDIEIDGYFELFIENYLNIKPKGGKE